MYNKKKYDKQYRIKNKERISIYNKQWREDNPDYQKEYYEKYYKGYYKKQNKEYYENNREKIKEYQSKYCKHKRKTDLKYKISRRISNAIYYSLKGSKAGRKWEDLVGYTLNDLIKRLKKTIPKGYNWQDYLEGKLHLDHIIPKSIFNFAISKHTDFKRCWSLENLQLLPAKSNMIKGNKLEKPFQPALKI